MIKLVLLQLMMEAGKVDSKLNQGFDISSIIVKFIDAEEKKND